MREAILDGEVVALDARWWRSMRDQRHVVAERRELADGRKEYRAPLLAEDADVAIR